MSLMIKNYCPKKEVSIVPVWSDNKFFYPNHKDAHSFKINHKITEKFIVLYSGNLGKTHNIKIIPAIAEMIRNPDIVFLIIGDGEMKLWLKNELKVKNLKNCKLLPRQPVSVLPYSFASADIALVCQAKGISKLSVPSKTYNYMSSGLPLLCIAEEDSELSKLVSKYKNGRCFQQDSKQEIVDFINEMKCNTELKKIFQKNSLKASSDFTPENVKIISNKF